MGKSSRSREQVAAQGERNMSQRGISGKGRITVPTAILKPRQEQRLLAGHLWIYQGNVARMEGQPAPGDIVDVRTASGRVRGRRDYNPPPPNVVWPRAQRNRR